MYNMYKAPLDPIEIRELLLFDLFIKERKKPNEKEINEEGIEEIIKTVVSGINPKALRTYLKGLVNNMSGDSTSKGYNLVSRLHPDITAEEMVGYRNWLQDITT